jgi:hypothetical protein
VTSAEQGWPLDAADLLVFHGGAERHRRRHLKIDVRQDEALTHLDRLRRHRHRSASGLNDSRAVANLSLDAQPVVVRVIDALVTRRSHALTNIDDLLQGRAEVVAPVSGDSEVELRDDSNVIVLVAASIAAELACDGADLVHIEALFDRATHLVQCALVGRRYLPLHCGLAAGITRNFAPEVTCLDPVTEGGA